MKTVYRIYDREKKEHVSVYMNVRAHDQEFFESESRARNSNCHGIYKDEERYAVIECVVVPKDVWDTLCAGIHEELKP